MPRTVTFSFDFLSPYAYLAHHALGPLAERTGVEVVYRPILLAALLGAHGHKGPAEIPPKRVYVFKDASRSAAILGVPLVPPPSHPFLPLLPLRACAQDMPEEVRRAFVGKLFDIAWGGARPLGDGRGVDDREVVGHVATEVGLDADAVLDAALSAEGKAQLRALTEEGVRTGLFGVPSMVVEGELFWGYDSLGHLERFLMGQDPLDDEQLAKWAALPASAARA